MTTLSKREEDIVIDGPTGPLGGALRPVEGSDQLVVILPGSGPVDRDGNAPKLGLMTDTYRLLSDGLAAAGIASLRVDKRGLFGSIPALADPNDVTIADYAEDTLAWIHCAMKLASHVWLAGHSEGGLVALETARRARDGTLAGMALLATPGRPIGRLLIEQLRAIPGNAALMPEIESTVAALESGQRRPEASLSEPLRGLFADRLQGYLIDLFAHDPAALARHWLGPGLILQGDADLQVMPMDAKRLGAAMPQARCRMLPSVTHMLKADLPGQPYATYTDPALPLHAEVIPELAAAVFGSGPFSSRVS